MIGFVTIQFKGTMRRRTFGAHMRLVLADSVLYIFPWPFEDLAQNKGNVHGAIRAQI